MVAKTAEDEYPQGASPRTLHRNTKRHNDIIERIDRQITSIENIIADLLQGVCIDEMGAHQRYSLAVRFLGQYQRVLTLRQAYDIEEPDNRQEEMLAKLMRQMRGEDVDEDED